MKANMHIHSKFSDGTMWPEEIAARGRRFGLEYMSLTDHDTMEGTDAFTEACASAGILSVPGVEVDCVAPEINFAKEILIYFPQGKYEHTCGFLKERLRAREIQARAYLEQAERLYAQKLKFEDFKRYKLGFLNAEVESLSLSFTKADIFSFSATGTSSPKISLIGNLRTDRFFAEFLSRKSPCEGCRENSGQRRGVCIIAHPGHMFRDSETYITEHFDALVESFRFFKACGVRGAELYYYGEESEGINSSVQRAGGGEGFLFTCGSDCHGRGSASDTLELFFGDFLPESLYQ
jgi:histidinol phosphatase-like PHP family hydrolase